MLLLQIIKAGRRDYEGSNLTELRWPRSSGGSLRSLTESITADRRRSSSPVLLSLLPSILGMEEDDAALQKMADFFLLFDLLINHEEKTTFPFLAEQTAMVVTPKPLEYKISYLLTVKF